MKTRGYYAFPDPLNKSINTCSRFSDSMPLIVNCTGSMESKFPFTTYNPSGRLDYYLMYIASGTLCVTLPCGVMTLGAGCAVLFPPHYPYRYVYPTGAEPLQYFWVHFTGSHAEDYLKKLSLSPSPTYWELGCDNHLPTHFVRLFEQFTKEQPFPELAAACTLEQLLLSLATTVHRLAVGKNPIRKSLRYINESYTSDIRIPDLAAMENLSNSRYSVLFRQVTGTSPIRYITRLRMDNACELLLHTDLSVKQIGILVGYEDPHFFSKLFKKYMGMSPQQYREEPNLHA